MANDDISSFKLCAVPREIIIQWSVNHKFEISLIREITSEIADCDLGSFPVYNVCDSIKFVLMMKRDITLMDYSFHFLCRATPETTRFNDAIHKYLNTMFPPLKPIEISLVDDQTDVIVIDESSEGEEADKTCKICFEERPLNGVISPCGHQMCFICLSDISIKTCPKCRGRIERKIKCKPI